MEHDAVKNPFYYVEGRKFEPKDVIRDWELNFNLGNVVKYIARAGRKDNAIEDLKKAQEYIKFEIDALENERVHRKSESSNEKENDSHLNKCDKNTEISNFGRENTGIYNVGDGNTGNYNVGGFNTGNRNTGDYNTGYYNTGDYNTENCNAGDCNIGFFNTGNYNTGYYNAGNLNTGRYNSGNRNTGDSNTGDGNTGDFNAANYSSGCFNTVEQKIMLFNKLSDWTYRAWLSSDARNLLRHMPNCVVEWVDSDDMSEDEKEAHPTYETTGGYLKECSGLESAKIRQGWWDGLGEKDKQLIKSLPNFDPDIFKQCTGIKVR